MGHISGDRTVISRIEPATSQTPLVSVVIATLDRPQLLVRALESVFNQTHRHLEIIVVVDRPHDETSAALRMLSDPRLRVVVSPHPLSGPAARNLGIDEAKGEWVAFLDDDDEWLPDKIEKQLAFAAGRGDVLISCLSRVVTPRSSTVQPTVIYDNSMPLDEYLFDRPSPFAGSGFMQTSSFFLPRAVLERIRFAADSAHDDWEFALRLSKELGIRIETVPEVLTVLYFGEERPSGTTRLTWKESLAWIDTMRPIITRRAYGGFCLSTVGSRAAREHSSEALILLLRRAFRYGRPRVWRLMAFASLWLMPASLHQQLKRLVR